MGRVDEDTRESIINWVNSVIGDRYSTASAWAKDAGISATTITRLINSTDYKSLPTTKAIGRLAAVAGSQPTYKNVSLIKKIPLITVRDFMRTSSVEAILSGSTDSMPVPDIPHKLGYSSFAFEVNGETMTGIGIYPKDHVIVDPSKLPENGDLVLVVGEGLADFYRYAPPHLIPYQVSGQGSILDMNKGYNVVGVAVHHQRDLSNIFKSDT